MLMRLFCRSQHCFIHKPLVRSSIMLLISLIFNNKADASLGSFNYFLPKKPSQMFGGIVRMHFTRYPIKLEEEKK